MPLCEVDANSPATLPIYFYQQLGISAKTLDGIHGQLKAKLASISELAKIRAGEIEVRFAAKRKRIAEIEKTLGRKRPSDAAQHPRFALYHHKRRLAILQKRLTEATEQVREPRMCFGSRKLLPASGETIPVVLASGDRVTLPRPAKDARRHVWSSWSRCCEDCQRFIQDVGVRVTWRDRTAREVLNPPAAPRRG